MHAETTTLYASAIAEEAFVLAYPLVLMNRVMEWATAASAPDSDTMRAPVNALVHGPDTPDTLWTSGWLDLAAEPIVLSVPDTHGRYYVLWLRDAWNTVFASVGARATGTAGGAFALLGPGQHGLRLPHGLTPIAAPTRTVRVTGCIEAVGETEAQALARAYDGIGLAPLSSLNGRPAPARPASVATGDPVEQVDGMDARAFFSEVSRLVKDNPPNLAARAVLDRLSAITGGEMPAPELQACLERGVQQGRTAIRAEAERPPGYIAGPWRVCHEPDRDDDPLRGAGAARSGRRTAPAADRLVARLDRDADGRPLDGHSRYLLRFAPDAPPPVDGYWSLTTSADAPGSAHSIGDLEGLAMDSDGSLPIYIQRRPPARKRRSNWLPAPPDGFNLALYLHWPREEALQRRWSPPPVTRAE